MPATVADVMCWSSLMIRPNCEAEKALQIMVEAEAEDLAVVDENDILLGILSDYELLKAEMVGALGDLDASQLMQCHPQHLAPEQPLSDALKLFREARISRAPVVRNGRLMGLIRRQDVLRAMWHERVPAPSETTTELPVVQPPKFLRSQSYSTESLADMLQS
ncbi:CBS domain-containing protein [bacterium]|nr:CBS domain-containing protein [bacterium]